ncbi:MAG: histidine kinase [Clostridiales bacterium]|nr:histidine kinase [Clostridiales bacterium]
MWKKTAEAVEDKQIALYEENILYLARLCDNIFKDVKDKSVLIYSDDKVMDILKRKKVDEFENRNILNGKVNAIFYSDDNIDSVAFYVESAKLMIYKKRNATTRFYKVKTEEEADSYFKLSYPAEEQGYSIGTLRNEEKDEYQLGFHQNITNVDQRPIARIEIIYNKSLFEPVFFRPNPRDLGRNFILDEGEKFAYEEFDEEMPDDFDNALMDAPEGVSRYKKDYLIMKRKLESFPYYVIKSISTKEISDDMMPFKNGMLMLFGLVIVIIAVIALVLSRIVRRPIEKFTGSIEQFRESEENIETEIKVDIEEMQSLAEQFSMMMGEINQLIDEKSEARYREKKAQLNMLMVQINPHFLYNALQTLQFMALRRNAFEINAMLTSLGKILRYSLNLGSREVTLAEELENVTEYLNIQKFRYVDELDMYIDRPDELPNFIVPKMIIQPLVENCFVHGFKGKTEDYKIKLEISCMKNMVTIKVCDNGWGMEEEEIVRLNKELEECDDYIISEHTGVQSVNFRIKQKYPNASMKLYKNDWFCVEIRISGGYDEDSNNR